MSRDVIWLVLKNPGPFFCNIVFMKILKDEIGAIYILQDKKPYFLVELINVKYFEIKFIHKEVFEFYNSSEKKIRTDRKNLLKKKLEF